jgi:hypothetical protein
MKLKLELKNVLVDDFDYSAVYVQSSVLKGLIQSHHTRPIVRIRFNNKSIYRKMRSKALVGLDKDSIVLDFLSKHELDAQYGDIISIEKASFINHIFHYLIKNPNEDIRIAWYFFVIGMIIGLIGIILSVLTFFVNP